jgi:ABC-type branched-subunit amino acid transport system ATPase component
VHEAHSSPAAGGCIGRGIARIPEGREVFPKVTVRENLRKGSYRRTAGAMTQARLAGVFEAFPRLKERVRQLAGTMSGGEQAMLSLGSGFTAAPKLLIIDEPSLGLSPLYVKANFNVIRAINEQGVTVLLVEQCETDAGDRAPRLRVVPGQGGRGRRRESTSREPRSARSVFRKAIGGRRTQSWQRTSTRSN